MKTSPAATQVEGVVGSLQCASREPLSRFASLFALNVLVDFFLERKEERGRLLLACFYLYFCKNTYMLLISNKGHFQTLPSSPAPGKGSSESCFDNDNFKDDALEVHQRGLHWKDLRRIEG